jgi:hypothetical protein
MSVSLAPRLMCHLGTSLAHGVRELTPGSAFLAAHGARHSRSPAIRLGRSDDPEGDIDSAAGVFGWVVRGAP